MALRPTDSIYMDATGRTYALQDCPELSGALVAYVARFKGTPSPETVEYLVQLPILNLRLPRPFDIWFVFFQWWLETGAGTTIYWIRDGNPAGIGIWKDGVPSPWGGKLLGEQSAAVHLVELANHTYPLSALEAWQDTEAADVFARKAARDKTHLQAVAALRMTNTAWPNVQRIEQFNDPVPPYDFVWAADPEYDLKITRLAAQVVPDLPDAKETKTMVDIGNRPLRIALGAGHANTSGGNTFETALNKQVTNAVIKLAKQSKGFDIRCYTPNDGLGSYPGPLDAAAAVARTWLSQGWAADILHELHHEGTGTPAIRGGFIIYPDSAGLSGRNPGNIDLDVQRHGGEMAKRLVAPFGGALRYPSGGAMSERQTGVGGQGYRLGVFGAWAENYFENNSFQFISEAAAYTNPQDLLAMQQLDFPAKQALGVLEMYAYIAKAAGNWTYPYSIGKSEPEPVPTNLAPDGLPYPEGLDFDILSQAFGRYVGDGRKAGHGTVPDFRYALDRKGAISRAWYIRGKQQDRYPAINDAWIYGERWYIQFQDGSIIWRPNDKSPFRFSN